MHMRTLVADHVVPGSLAWLLALGPVAHFLALAELPMRHPPVFGSCAAAVADRAAFRNVSSSPSVQ